MVADIYSKEMTVAQLRTKHHQDLYIDGKWQAQSGAGSIDVLSASTEEVIGAVPEGSAADVGDAVQAARRAFPGWSETPAAERAAWLEKLAGALKDRGGEIANTIAQEVGSPISMATSIQAGLPVAVTQSYAALIATFALEQQIGNSLVV